MNNKRFELSNEAHKYIGQTTVNNQGEIMFVVEYRKYTDITVQFQKTGELTSATMGNFKTGKIKSKFTPTIFGVGIIGNETISDENGNMIIQYKAWTSMIQRCHSKQYQEKHPTYCDCTICDEWYYFKNFKKWFDENYYKVEDTTMCLDKDILFKGNKVYSPKTCIFVPRRVNILFTKTDAKRGELPIGVSKSGNGKYYSQINDFNMITHKKSKIHLGFFDDEITAFNEYKKCKEKVILDVANEYKSCIPQKLYNALINYKVEIND